MHILAFTKQYGAFMKKTLQTSTLPTPHPIFEDEEEEHKSQTHQLFAFVSLFIHWKPNEEHCYFMSDGEED